MNSHTLGTTNDIWFAEKRWLLGVKWLGAQVSTMTQLMQVLSLDSGFHFFALFYKCLWFFDQTFIFDGESPIAGVRKMRQNWKVWNSSYVVMTAHSIGGVVNKNLLALMKVQADYSGLLGHVHWLILFTPVQGCL